jgi:hypothetical protein
VSVSPATLRDTPQWTFDYEMRTTIVMRTSGGSVQGAPSGPARSSDVRMVVREFDVLFGPLAEVDVAGLFPAIVEDFAAITGLEVYRSDGALLSAGCGSVEMRVDIKVESFYRQEGEPFVSHPFAGSVKANNDPAKDREFATSVYERLVASGRFRAILLGDSDILLSSHFPMSAW